MLDVKALLTKILLRLSDIGTVYSNAVSVAISDTNIDNNTAGASITVPIGTYIVAGYWAFNTRTTSGITNSAIRILSDKEANPLVQERVYAATQNWNSLNATAIYTATSDNTKLQIFGATTRPYTSASSTWIKAIRIL